MQWLLLVVPDDAEQIAADLCHWSGRQPAAPDPAPQVSAFNAAVQCEGSSMVSPLSFTLITPFHGSAATVLRA